MNTPPAPTALPPVETLSFEQAMAELEQIVRGMETGQTTLEASIAAYERGMSLQRHCAKRLAEAELRIAQITQNGDGTVGTKPLPEQD